MLCRALVAVIAVTCTLSHGRATLRLDRIKDLVCVLVLSGMQKEDLDVSMLTKLQRYNVNIDDMNNDELREMCIKSQDDKHKNNDTHITESYVNKTKNAILEDFKSNTSIEIVEKPVPAEYDMYKASKENKINKVKENDEEIQYNDKQKQLESIFNLLEDTQINKAMKDPLLKPDFIKEQEIKRSITDTTFETNDTLKRLFENYVAKRRNLSAQSKTTPKSLNIDDMFEKLYLLRIRDTENDTNINSDFQHKASYPPIHQNTYTQAIPEELGEKREKTNILNETNINDELTLINKLNRFKPYTAGAELFQNHNHNTEESLKRTRNPYQNSLRRTDTRSAYSIEPKQMISSDIIKEIADNVKEMVLQDLRKELHKITTVTTTTTIVSTTTTQSTTKKESAIQTTLKEENIKTPDSLMKKFLELFEEIKSLKQSGIVFKSDSEKSINDKDKSLLPFQMQKVETKDLEIHSQTTKPINIIQTKLNFNTNQVNRIIKHNPTVNSDNLYNFASQQQRYRSNGTITKQITITEAPVFVKHEPKTGLLPLTVQTNNIEILPIGIPIDKPQNLIRQNIVIGTQAPYRILPIKNDNQVRGHPHNIKATKSFEAYKSKKHPYLSKEPHRPSNFHDNDKDDVIKFTLSNNGHSKYSSGYYEKINIGKFSKPFSDEIISDTPRYHEKLEKMEPYLDYPEENKYAEINDCCNEKYTFSKEMADCCNGKIVSRQQMSLNNIKKKSYDDTHFKKFIQSQQKVTDMLEKILGDKENIQSVETA
ncbi:putative leucine-rich repeat-containing protein DDB_G0290503 [Bicyclus anynana]|uniref:Leucine-rich repeat-containing protein DDB_G0290503 n=1 Tax=Bicyclus anynana TaxID=110368 RepID=A0ABM3LYH0_BICAN|nr:putative leucine-rich repeat-containing protein DDB_G0290503 [Bicyclus anynana]